MILQVRKLLLWAGVLYVPVIRREGGGQIVLVAGKHPLNPAIETARGQLRELVNPVRDSVRLRV